jgi:hypothetical protein
MVRAVTLPAIRLAFAVWDQTRGNEHNPSREHGADTNLLAQGEVHFGEGRHREANDHDVEGDVYNGMPPHDVDMRQTLSLVFAIPHVPEMTNRFAGKDYNQNCRDSPAESDSEDEVGGAAKVLVREQAEEEKENRNLGEGYR